MKVNFAIVTPMANESNYFDVFVDSLKSVLNILGCGRVYFVIDKVSTDNTLELCNKLSLSDNRFTTVWAPENKNVVDAYIRGYKEALKNNHEFIIEMDAGLSHDPEAIPLFLDKLNNGYECVFGSRFMENGAMVDSGLKRKFLSKSGTFLSNLLLGTKMHDMTSGFQGFDRKIVEKFTAYNLLSKAHFYQTELRYLLRETNYIEIPICYRAPSPSVSKKAIYNSFSVLFHYFFLRLLKKPVSLR